MAYHRQPKKTYYTFLYGCIAPFYLNLCINMNPVVYNVKVHRFHFISKITFNTNCCSKFLLRREALYSPVWGRSCHVMSCDVTLLTCRQKIIVKVNIMGEILSRDVTLLTCRHLFCVRERNLSWRPCTHLHLFCVWERNLSWRPCTYLFCVRNWPGLRIHGLQ